jgi:ubiquitin C
MGSGQTHIGNQGAAKFVGDSRGHKAKLGDMLVRDTFSPKAKRSRVASTNSDDGAAPIDGASCVDKVELRTIPVNEAFSPEAILSEKELPAKRNADKFHVSVTPLNGATSMIDIGPADSVNDLKLAIRAKLGVIPCQQKLFLAGDHLSDGYITMAGLGLEPGSEFPPDITLVVQPYEWKSGDDFIVLKAFECALALRGTYILEKGARGCFLGRTPSGQFEFVTDSGTPLVIPEDHLANLEFVEEVRHGPDTFKVIMKTLTGKSLVIKGCRTDDTIGEIKKKVQTTQGVPPHDQRMIFAGKELEDGRSLRDYNIQKMSTMHLILRLCGGC